MAGGGGGNTLNQKGGNMALNLFGIQADRYSSLFSRELTKLPWVYLVQWCTMVVGRTHLRPEVTYVPYTQVTLGRISHKAPLNAKEDGKCGSLLDTVSHQHLSWMEVDCRSLVDN
jgi:hypothetical protein